VILSPAGIALMWMRLPWARRTKIIVSVIAVVWLLVVIGKKNHDDKERARRAAARRGDHHRRFVLASRDSAGAADRRADVNGNEVGGLEAMGSSINVNK
jgi:hypothetical protein